MTYQGYQTCHCRICRRVKCDLYLEPREWVDFLMHRTEAVVELRKPGSQLHYAYSDGERIYYRTRTSEPKEIGKWVEEVRFTSYLGECRIEVYDSSVNQFPSELATHAL